MHRNVIFTFGLIVYFLVVTVGLYQFEAGLITSAVVLLGLPTYLLARYSAAPTTMLVTITCFAVGIALLLEGTAYAYGLWSLASPSGLMFPGGLSFEMLTATLLKVLFLVLFYELLFDDGNYSTSESSSRFVSFMLFMVGSGVLLAVFFGLFNKVSSPSAYYWITIALLLSSVAMLASKQVLTLRFFDKIAYFVVVAAIPMLCIEFLAVANEYKVITAMLHPVTIPGVALALPFGEILLALSMPTFVTAVYELYLDDQM